MPRRMYTTYVASGNDGAVLCVGDILQASNFLVITLEYHHIICIWNCSFASDVKRLNASLLFENELFSKPMREHKCTCPSMVFTQWAAIRALHVEHHALQACARRQKRAPRAGEGQQRSLKSVRVCFVFLFLSPCVTALLRAHLLLLVC